MKDGDIKISQSLAILKYIAKKHNLLHDGTLKGETMANVIEVIFLRRNINYFMVISNKWLIWEQVFLDLITVELNLKKNMKSH